jgi:hypothetical protein
VVRKKVGLRPITSDWTLDFAGTICEEGGKQIFFGENWRPGEKRGTAKAVCYTESRELLWEEDYYYSGRNFPSYIEDEGTVFEGVTVHYDYQNDWYYVSYNINEENANYDPQIGEWIEAEKLSATFGELKLSDEERQKRNRAAVDFVEKIKKHWDSNAKNDYLYVE